MQTAVTNKTKLSPGELAFMVSALDEAGGKITPGTMINYHHTEGRAVSGLEKKGMVLTSSPFTFLIEPELNSAMKPRCEATTTPAVACTTLPTKGRA